MTADNNLGEIIIAPEVLEIIVAIATSKIEGVYSLRSKRLLTPMTNPAKKLDKKSEGQGVYIRIDEDRVIADIYVYLMTNARVPEVAEAIQVEVKEKVLAQTEIDLSEVNVHVTGIVPESTEKPAFDDLFKEGFFDAQ